MIDTNNNRNTLLNCNLLGQYISDSKAMRRKSLSRDIPSKVHF
jgi:hypothetical protein